MKQPSILSRYILKESLLYFGVTLFAFTAILLTLNMLKFASLIINKGVGFSEIAMVFVSIIPTFLEIALPMAALLGMMLAFARLSGDSELIVIRASGISILQLIPPVAIFGVIVGCLSLLVSLYGRPWGYEKLSSTLFDIASSRSTAGLDAGVFTKLGNLTIYAESIDHETGEMTKILIDDKRERESRKVVVAKSGTLINDEESHDVVFNLARGVIHEMAGKKYSVTEFSTNRITVDPQDLFAEDAEKKGRQFNSMSLGELGTARSEYRTLLERVRSGEKPDFTSLTPPFGQRLTEDQWNTRELKKRINRASIEQERRFSMPFASFILALVGMALGVQPPRTQKTWGIGISAVFGMFVFVLYYGILSIGMALGEGGSLPPILALWIPNLCVAALAAIVLWNLGKERWQSINHALDGIGARFHDLRRSHVQ